MIANTCRPTGYETLWPWTRKRCSIYLYRTRTMAKKQACMTQRDAQDVGPIDYALRDRLVFSLRKYLTAKGYVETILPNEVDYFIRGAGAIRTSTGHFLRTNTEPEIWDSFTLPNRLFTFATFFRKESPSSLIHKEEFMVLDTYIRNPLAQDRQSSVHLLRWLRFLESELKLPRLSKLPILQVDHARFEQWKNSDRREHEPSIVMVTNYPEGESFFDAKSTKKGRTKKGEFFIVDGDISWEIGVFGFVGRNLNKKAQLCNYKFVTNPRDYENKIFGLCVGVERLALAYKRFSCIN